MTESCQLRNHPISVAFRVWPAAAALAFGFFSAAPVCAQENTSTAPGTDVFSMGKTYSDQSSTTCDKTNTSPYAGMNPLTSVGASVGAGGAGGCSLPNASFLRQVGSICYFSVARVAPIKAFIIPMDILAQVERLGYSCGVDQADPNCFAVCTGSAIPQPPAGTQLPNPPGPPGKDLKRVYPPSPPGPTQSNPPGSPDIPLIDKTMAACLSAAVPVLPQQTVQPNSIASAAKTFMSPKAWSNLPQQPTGQSQIFLEEMGMALQAQDAYDSIRGLTGLAKINAKGGAYDPQQAEDYMVGWLDHCLQNAGLEQVVPPSAQDSKYQIFSGGMDDGEFQTGYEDFPKPPLPLTLAMPQKTNP
jgi:hypothetical protein